MLPEMVSDTAHRLRAIAERWADAELRGDTAVLDELLCEDFVGIGPRGLVLPKRAWIGRHAIHALEHYEFSWDDPQLHLEGPVAVMTAINRVRGLQAGNTFDEHFRGMLVLVRSARHWRIVAASQSGPIAELPAPPAHGAP